MINFLKELVKNLIEPIKPVDCVLRTSEDPMCHKLFKYTKDDEIYKYLFSAVPEESRAKLVVVYQHVKTNKIYTRPWNSFFYSVNGVPRFKELSPTDD